MIFGYGHQMCNVLSHVGWADYADVDVIARQCGMCRNSVGSWCADQPRR